MADILASTLRQRGLDPGEFSVFAFGGAGPAHCGGYTFGIGFKDVIVCPFAATFSAFGASTADVYHRYESSPFVVLPGLPFNVTTGRFTVTEIMEKYRANIERYNRICETLIERAFGDMTEEGFKKDEVRMNFILEMRYGGQLHEVVTRPQRIMISNVDDLNHILTTFEEEYIRLYSEGAMYSGGGIEIYNITVEVSAGVPKPTPVKHPYKGKDPSAAFKGVRDVWFDKGYAKSNVYEMLRLENGNYIKGPAIIEGVDTTFVVPSDREVVMDEYLNMVMTQKA